MTRQRFRLLRYPFLALALILGLLVIHHQYWMSAAPASVQRMQTVTISNAGFLPNKLTARKGEIVSLTIINTDIRPHNLVIQELNVSSIDLKPSQSTTLQFAAAKEGQFPFVSNTPGYPETGYQGILIIN
ncbi:cupredoxin domain-containing protein [Brevibacillus ruminantium]|uniref:Cupredoxin domain-containing protein n=1 Tax=Brevibacillus ruminantium TaxID=2950604 RepID=A0ABY4WPZ1_9BACL|nr:cupredoxin domain-containing protein [Brevibacillus ruminantium]USG66701.1 cupredoxin domain-containing protein [Brevibacillus ruminantium]